MLGTAQAAIRDDQCMCILASQLQQLEVADHVTQAQLSQPVLSRAEEFAQTAQASVLLCQRETVRDPGEEPEPLFGLVIRRLREEVTFAWRRASADPAAQLVELR